ncbi:MAG: hypothetical protein JAZ03_15335 [Candidatus Thiodiazotropha taylori]|nr:hypothetical protein [Candidatus Thiodiazotropha taylori]MCG8033535.1 hypothetical protein [Candidatus Thiodiazotropha taylori]MCW4335302.1 hypothetical protein [Candidatus Thiodiazotropha endolucinida]MCW4335305.1 hypothetical protein [Candidatus Thiodiazotropha endolucinida]
MSSKDRKYINRPINFNGTLTKQPLLLSDSKAKYVLDYKYLIEDLGYFIDFQYRGGARFLDLYFWLQRNLHFKVQQYGNLVLYIWLGTCDLTEKKSVFEKYGSRKKKITYVDLRHKNDEFAIAYVRQQIDKFCQLVSHFPSVQIVFLEIPCYSIEQYNKHLKAPNPESFHDKDLILTERIGIINDYIRDVNRVSGFNTPRFKRDLIKYRKSEGESQRKSLDFTGYKDGIHPDKWLAGVWMKKIVTHMLHTCR